MVGSADSGDGSQIKKKKKTEGGLLMGQLCTEGGEILLFSSCLTASGS